MRANFACPARSVQCRSQVPSLVSRQRVPANACRTRVPKPHPHNRLVSSAAQLLGCGTRRALTGRIEDSHGTDPGDPKRRRDQSRPQRLARARGLVARRLAQDYLQPDSRRSPSDRSNPWRIAARSLGVDGELVPSDWRAPPGSVRTGPRYRAPGRGASVSLPMRNMPGHRLPLSQAKQEDLMNLTTMRGRVRRLIIWGN